MSTLFFSFLGTLPSCFQTRAALQLEILALRHLWVAKASFALNSGKSVAVVEQAAGDRSAIRLAEC